MRWRGVRGLRKIHGEAFGSLRIFELLATVAAGDLSQTFGSGIFLGVDGRLGRSSGRCGGIAFACFNAGAILLGEDLRLLQIFVGVDVGIFFLLRCLARFFLASGFGDGL